MGNKLHCLSRTGDQGPKGPIVPDQDPLLKSAVTSRRIVRAEIGRDFEIQAQVLGTGYSGAVRLAIHRGTKQRVAVKQFAKRRLKPHRLKLLQSEVTVYLGLDHPNICRLLHAYEGKRDVWLVMELCGCELYSRLCERKVYHERDAADVMLQMLQALNYLHSHRIVHRDLKLENWMYGEEEADDRLKLIDFGFSQRLGAADEVLEMPCGAQLAGVAGGIFHPALGPAGAFPAPAYYPTLLSTSWGTDQQLLQSLPQMPLQQQQQLKVLPAHRVSKLSASFAGPTAQASPLVQSRLAGASLAGSSSFGGSFALRSVGPRHEYEPLAAAHPVLPAAAVAPASAEPTSPHGLAAPGAGAPTTGSGAGSGRRLVAIVG